MSNSTLYLIQSSYANTLQCIHQLRNLVAEADAIVLMGEAVLFIADEQIQQLGTCYVLEQDVQILAKNANYNHMQVISYAEFADLCLQYNRCVTLK
ncbi:hypothetical protein B9T33_11930 [Acinetobacter sp. ANC 5054]|uniref:DsrH/TusB family sulfur metabolism protein n=1 Tax=Acinetobacter sp. ANC 5054 TaxID=1977877 RepID=UPI000A35680C|nr:DsrH/TusB family sulfur metabolism protein [Acinetobacter sp. ANC 5054]OTG79491.1 hypothetical protein B9T33_11930 [Acinetobacter sp. ANC 5054]